MSIAEQNIINAEEALGLHGLEAIHPLAFIAKQQEAQHHFSPHFAHHAQVDILEQPDGLLLIRKTFGAGSRPIPFNIAGELGDDYLLHVARLKKVGIRVAENYGLSVKNNDGYGVITVHQLLFPNGTILDQLRKPQVLPSDQGEMIRQTVCDTLTPVLRFQHQSIREDESWVFLDNAPKNVAPVQTPAGETVVFYFDFFVPRVRNPDGRVKVYPIQLHTRSEAEMQKRFFAHRGIVHNFLRKARKDLIDTEALWDVFATVVSQELRPFWTKLFQATPFAGVADAPLPSMIEIS